MKKQIENLIGSPRRGGCRNLFPVLFLFPLLSLSVAKGEVRISVVETGGGVTISAFGTVNLGGLTGPGYLAGSLPSVDPREGRFTLGPSAPSGDTYWAEVGQNFTLADNFGPGPFTGSSRGTGVVFGFSSSNILLPEGYLSGAEIASSSTFDGATVASLGMDPGEYIWTWGSGGNADFAILTVSSSQPEADNSAKKRTIQRSIKRLKTLIKKAQRKEQVAKVRNLKAKIAKLTKSLRAL